MKVRVISALIVIIALVPFLIIGSYPFTIVLSLIGLLGYKEIIDLKKNHKKIPILMVFLGMVSLVLLMVGDYNVISLEYAVSFPTLLIPLMLLFIPTVFYNKDDYSAHDALYLLSWIYFIGVFIRLVIIIRALNIYVLLYLLSITIFTDTFAYLIGSLIGKHKMAPVISPKKSWEGFFGGLIGGSTIAMIIYSNLVYSFSLKLFIITIILSVVGQLGDLFFSKVKRENEIKDFSNLIPGHGGMLDRIDSIMFVIIFYTILINIL
jgi:phosphatidate cytidylyltransferase